MTQIKVFYFLLQEQTKEGKLEWFANTKFGDIPFDPIKPDDKGNWINQPDNDFEQLLPLIDKNVKAGKSQEAIFQLFSRGVETNRDEWVYDLKQENLFKKVEFFIARYNKSIELGINDPEIKWNSSLVEYAKSHIKINLQGESVVQSIYRPYSRQYLYADKILCHRLTQNHYETFGDKLNQKNQVITLSAGTRGTFSLLATKDIPTLDIYIPNTAQCLPLYRYEDNGNRIDNITDWGLTQVQRHYNKTITKLDIFHYTYAVLHCPNYRTKYEVNLKQDSPRLPFYDNFFEWVEWGKELMDLHLNYESVELYDLTRIETTNQQVKVKLKADKEKGWIDLDGVTILQNIPAIAWDYKLGNRSALEWILDQYKEKKPKDSTIAKLFDTYRFADYKEQVIDLLQRVCTVSVKTREIIAQMAE